MPQPRSIELFGIVHGGVLPDLRKISAQHIGGMDF
jgi:queuine/archaeosine tRNA-ribosyltransferase